jgi:hypothetical protein
LGAAAEAAGGAALVMLGTLILADHMAWLPA